MLRVVQVGAYPPPYGGVTVHVMRLHEHLRSHGIHSQVLDLSRTPKDASGVSGLTWTEATSFLETLDACIVHFHNFEVGNAGAYRRLARRHLTVLSLHNERFGREIADLGPLRRQIVLARLRDVRCVVVDSARCRRMAEGIWGAGTEIHTIPEFIPPADVPPLEHEGLLGLRRSCRFLLASNAWQICFHDGEDLYGLDLLVETLAELVHARGLDVGLAFLLPTIGDEVYLQTIRSRIGELGLQERFLLVTQPIPESSSLWKAADVVVRATNTDGNSLSVLEALAVGTPVIASDCVDRPDGAVLFRNRSATDLAQQVASVLDDLAAHHQRLQDLAIGENATAFVDLYDKLRRKWLN